MKLVMFVRYSMAGFHLFDLMKSAHLWMDDRGRMVKEQRDHYGETQAKMEREEMRMKDALVDDDDDERRKIKVWCLEMI